MTYFVIAPNRQRFGPADTVTLNQWIREGRILPQTLLQDSVTCVEIVAEAIPGLDFSHLPPLTPTGHNPYGMAAPSPRPGLQATSSSAYEPAVVGNGQVIAAWVCTIVAPVLMPLCYLGIAAALFGAISGAQCMKQGSKLAGASLIGINCLWMVLFVVGRVWLAAHFG